jgi:hypothetical protein
MGVDSDGDGDSLHPEAAQGGGAHALRLAPAPPIPTEIPEPVYGGAAIGTLRRVKRDIV